jgi:predicted transcriptional regulator
VVAGIPLPRLRHVRQRLALSQHDLALRSDVTLSTISRLERGTVTARPSTIRKLAQALEVAPQELMAPEPRPRRR